MTNKIIKSNLFEANVTKKTKWIFVKLENDIGVFGWGEATLQGKEKEIFRNEVTYILGDKPLASTMEQNDYKFMLASANVSQRW